MHATLEAAKSVAFVLGLVPLRARRRKEFRIDSYRCSNAILLCVEAARNVRHHDRVPFDFRGQCLGRFRGTDPDEHGIVPVWCQSVRHAFDAHHCE